jgi:TolA-binding protein
MVRFVGVVLFFLGLAAPARAEAICIPQASGVAGVIADQADVIAAVNCLGQQLARLRSDATVSDRNEAARIDELARQIAMLQNAVVSLSQRVAAIEANLRNIEQPLAKQPW